MRTAEPAVVVRPIDPADEPALRSWWEVGEAASRERAFDAWPVWAVSRVALRHARPDRDVTLVTATDDDGRVVGAGRLEVPLLDNPHLAELEVHVVPDARRQGVGSTVLADLEARAVAAGRRVLLGTTFAPVGAESAGTLFCAARGYPVASHEETKLVDLRTAPAGWDTLDRRVAERLAAYSVVGFERRVPAEHVEAFCAMLAVFTSMVPTGDLELGPASWDAERLHATEQRFHESGRTWIGALAVAPDGTACGFSELSVHDADPRHASVGGTLVLTGHRGHHLGLAMKLHTHRRVLELFPDCRHVETGNAGVNAPMNAVNEAMGYRVVERALDVQKKVATAS
ncbi:GNAT family N-acetyltransferase [Nocardioides abyssi]|uniref:GNAT family N-acetyltransferase n=1 Tax=Nocardioides abyssi TaxID=3058370 RepID=A0ABT8EZZ7_9ACTN|nr:GNAT family N-acetyltransferase [Nocardioides abyssi]MDN4163599.1 GNAT family N-acetyltransferase [Nocardioides abyssi]